MATRPAVAYGMALWMFALLLAAPAGGATPAAALGTLRQQVQRARAEVSSQATFDDYRRSPYQPSEIIERVHGLGDDRAWTQLCQELTALDDENLELFEDEIRKPDHQKHLPCAPALLARIARYWKEAETELAAAHPLAAGQLVSVSITVNSDKAGVLADGTVPGDAVALTFDDGPHPTRTVRVLQILADAGVKATFFQIGKSAAAHPEIAQKVRDAGHSIGSHTFSHPNMARLPESHAEAEIDSGDASVSLALGLKPGQLRFFRFPYGAKTAGEQDFVRKRGDTTFFWNMDSSDWRIRDPHKLFINVLAELDRAKHGIILFHDIHEQTVIVLPHVLAELRARHLRTVVFVAAPQAAVSSPAAAPWER